MNYGNKTNTMKTAEEIYDLVAFLRTHQDCEEARKEGIMQIKSYAKEHADKVAYDCVTDYAQYLEGQLMKMKTDINTPTKPVGVWYTKWITPK